MNRPPSLPNNTAASPFSLATTLEEVKGAASLCIKCAGCTYAEWPQTYALCPTYSRDECFTFSAGGMLYLIKALADGQIGFSQPVAELLSTCTSCGACDSRCGIIRSQAPYANPLDVIRLARFESTKRGFVPQWGQRTYAEVRQSGDFSSKAGIELSGGVRDDAAATVLFAECLHSKTEIQAAQSAASLLQKMGEPVAIFSEAGCCGSTLYDYGFWEQLRPLVQAQSAKMKALEDRTFVFINPHCQEFIQKSYAKIAPDHPNLQGKHLVEVLAGALKTGKLKGKEPESVTVSYHDPCYLGRRLGIYDAPREVLSSLDGVTLVEMERNRENSFCCGARATGSYLPDIGGYASGERISEFKATGADLLITACPHCKYGLQRATPADENFRVKDLFEFVDERTQ